ncbi:MAG: E3 ubiquitin-protein ligase SlrP [Candidatus Anoxychlamydiales bacterium]|nr:E3 ubiquitin-protein ligase SlrP [Candidatus Anoxychlamydiales bacterium]
MTSPVSETGAAFQTLPQEDKLKIFSYLDIPDLTSVSHLSNGFKELANDQSIWSDIINRIGLNHSKYETVSAIKAKIKKIHEIGKTLLIQEKSYIDIFKHPYDHYIKYRNIKKPKESITIENTKETLRKINEIKIRDTLTVWRNIYQQAEHITGKPAIEIPKFDELKKSTDKKNIKQAFASWINNNKDKFTLTRLDLNYSNLYYLPKEIGKLSQLQTLDLYNNKLTSIPKEIGNLSQLQRLYLEKNNLTSIPKEIGSLAQLQELYLSNNKLTSIPGEIGNLPQLRLLDLKYNNLTSIPKEIGNSPQLQTLNLYTNKLTSIPKEIGSLAQLQTLYLSNNKLTSIPGEIGNLSQLQVLDLEYNNLTSIPGEIGNLSQLYSLNLSKNSISYYPKCLDRLTNTKIIGKNILIAHKVTRFLGRSIAHHLYNKIYGPIAD